jgi:hypothetical protein
LTLIDVHAIVLGRAGQEHDSLLKHAITGVSRWNNAGLRSGRQPGLKYWLPGTRTARVFLYRAGTLKRACHEEKVF